MGLDRTRGRERFRAGLPRATREGQVVRDIMLLGFPVVLAGAASLLAVLAVPIAIVFVSCQLTDAYEYSECIKHHTPQACEDKS